MWFRGMDTKRGGNPVKIVFVPLYPFGLYIRRKEFASWWTVSFLLEEITFSGGASQLGERRERKKCCLPRKVGGNLAIEFTPLKCDTWNKINFTKDVLRKCQYMPMWYMQHMVCLGIKQKCFQTIRRGQSISEILAQVCIYI